MEKRKKLIAKLAIILCAVIWGGSFVLVKVIAGAHGPGFILAVRFTVASLLIGFAFRKHLKNLDKQCVRHGVMVGVAIFLGFLCQTTGLVFTEASKSSFLSTTYCVLTPFVYWIITRNRPESNHFIAGIVCLTGIGFVSLKSSFTMSFGDSITLLSGVFYAVEIALLSTLCRKDDMMMVTFVEMTVSAILAWIYFAFTEDLPTAISLSEVAAIAYIAVLGTFVGLSLQNWAQKYVDSAESALLLAFESIAGAVMGVIFLGEGLTPRIVLGFGLIFLSVVVSEVGNGMVNEE